MITPFCQITERPLSILVEGFGNQMALTYKHPLKTSFADESITLSVSRPLADLWSEIKFQGKSIKRRSYHTSCLYHSALYVYGGYDTDAGIMADFQKIDLEGEHAWVQLTSKALLYPGPRHGHSAVVHKSKMYLFGGKTNSMKSTNRLSVFDFESHSWTQPQTTGVMPSMDSHSSVVYKDSMYVFGGFVAHEEGQYSNAVHKLDFESLEWVKLEVKGKAPKPRGNACLQVVGDCLYLFGGSDLDEKLKDLWRLNMCLLKWEFIDTKQACQQVPDTRAGHSMTAFKDKLILFGGIQSVTHQKDDVFVYDTVSAKWRLIEDVQSLAKRAILRESMIDNELDSPSKKPGDMNISGVKSTKQHSFSKSLLTETRKSPEKQQKTQQMTKHQLRKHHLLNQFQLTAQQSDRFRNPSPTLESLKNSIMSINSSTLKKRVDENLLREILLRKSSKKRPCARDGHTATLHGGHLVLLAGDRHLMSFNDMYLLNLEDI